MDLRNITTYEAGVIQAAMNRKLQKVTDALLKRYGLTKMQWFIIGTILDAGSEGVRLSELADTLGTSMSYLTTAINLLESRGILERKDNEKDTRSKLIAVASDYVPVCRDIETTLRNGLRASIYSKIDPAEFGVYIKVMRELAGIELDTDD